METIRRIFPLLRRTEEGKPLPAYLELDLVEGEMAFGVGPVPEKPGAVYLPVSPFVTQGAIEGFLKDDYEARKALEDLRQEAKVLKTGEVLLTEGGKRLVETLLSKLEALEKGYVLEVGEWIQSLVSEGGIEASFVLIPLKREEPKEVENGSKNA